MTQDPPLVSSSRQGLLTRESQFEQQPQQQHRGEEEEEDEEDGQTESGGNKAPDTLRQLCCVLTYYTLTIIDPSAYFKILREYLASILHSIQSVAMHTHSFRVDGYRRAGGECDIRVRGETGEAEEGGEGAPGTEGPTPDHSEETAATTPEHCRQCMGALHTLVFSRNKVLAPSIITPI